MDLLEEEVVASFRQRDLRSEQEEQVEAGEEVLRRTDLWWEPEVVVGEEREQMNRAPDRLAERGELLLQTDRRF